MDHLIVDSQSPLFDTAAHPVLSGFGPRLPCSGEPAPIQVGHRSIIGFPDNVGHLARGGRDGWGRAFSQGLLCALAGGYDYVAHIESDLLTRLARLRGFACGKASLSIFAVCKHLICIGSDF